MNLVLEHTTTVPCDVQCSRCDRRLAVAISYAPVPKVVVEGIKHLNPDDFCRWCARALTDEAEEQQPIAGYIAFAKALMGERRNAHHDPIRTEESA